MELDTGASDSVTSTPRSISDEKSTVRLMVSFGGKIIPRPHDNQLRYVGGDTRIVAVNRSITFSLLLSKLSKLLSTSVDFTVKYQLPNEELDALITVSTDEDVENMMEEFDRLSLSSSDSRIPRLRLFLFPPTNNDDDEEVSRSSSIVSLLDGSRKRENWFLDALNGGSSSSIGLERNKSEASSIVSEVPDYLFGLDNNSDDPPPPPVKFRTKSGLSEPNPHGSDPGSPVFGSGSSAPSMPNLPPVKTKPEKTNMNPVEEVGGPVWGPGGSPYPGPGHAVQQIPVYYVPAAGSGPGMMGHGNVVPVSVPIQGQNVSQYGPGPNPGPVQVAYPGPGQLYEVQMQGNMHQQQPQPMYYGVSNGGGLVAAYSGSGRPVSGDDHQDGSQVRILQG